LFILGTFILTPKGSNHSSNRYSSIINNTAFYIYQTSSDGLTKSSEER